VLRDGFRPGLIYSVSHLEFLVQPSTLNNWRQLKFQLRKIKKNNFSEVLGNKQTSESLVIIQECDDCKSFMSMNIFVIRCFFVLIDFLGLTVSYWFFFLNFKEFSLHNQISMLIALLLYIFDELFDCGWFEVYLLFSNGSIIDILPIFLQNLTYYFKGKG
jgi:hypothetical protein